MDGYPLIPLTTVRGNAPTVLSVTQEEDGWADLGPQIERGAYVEAAFWVHVLDLAPPATSGGNITLYLQSSSTPDESLFGSVGPGVTLAVSATPIVVRSVRTPGATPLARYVRWRLEVPGGSSGAWSATLRISMVPLRSRLWVPTDISGCALWLQSDKGITSSGSPATVSNWADLSGNGRDAAQSTSTKRPLYTAASINNLPSLAFDGTDDVLATSAFSLGVYTVLLVTTGQGGNGYFFTRSAAGVEVDTLYGSTGNTTYVNRSGTTSGYNNTTNWGQWGTSTARLLTQLYGGTHATHRNRMNAVEQSWTGTSSGDPGVGTTSHQFVIAGRNDSAVPANIKVAEVIVYDTALGATDLSRVEAYLRRRYALF